MERQNGIKRLAKLGTARSEGRKCWVEHKGHVVSFISMSLSDNSNIDCIRVRRATDHDDIQSDYLAGSYFDTMAQAIKYVA